MGFIEVGKQVASVLGGSAELYSSTGNVNTAVAQAARGLVELTGIDVQGNGYPAQFLNAALGVGSAEPVGQELAARATSSMTNTIKHGLG